MQFQLQSIEKLAQLLDNQFELFGVRFGLDAVFGLLPWAGDTVALCLSLIIVAYGWQLPMPKTKKLHMLINVGIDYLIDLIPIVGDVSWIVYKPNLRNVKIIKQYASAKIIVRQVAKEEVSAAPFSN